MLLLSTFISGAAVTSLMFATQIWHMGVARVFQGACLALVPTASLNIVRDMFPKFAQTKAFFVYMLLTKVADAMLYSSLYAIVWFGWRNL